MKNYRPVMSFDKDVARLDRDLQRGDEAAAVTLLAELAGSGPALELGIGTGRIALPLAAGGDQIAVTIGDFAEVPVAGVYRLIYVVFNSFFNLLTQDEQVRCFERVAAHLTSDGLFVIEAYTPAFLHRLQNHQYVEAEAIEVDAVRLDLLRHDPATQMITESHVSFSAAGVRLNPVVQRYAWPSELDLMARIAGLRLKHRWGGWQREPFSASSPLHVSVYAH